MQKKFTNDKSSHCKKKSFALVVWYQAIPCDSPMPPSFQVSAFFHFLEVFKGEIPEPVSISDLFNGYLWQIENKYYTADIQVCSCCVTSPPKTESKLALNFFFQSIVIIFDENEVSNYIF